MISTFNTFYKLNWFFKKQESPIHMPQACNFIKKETLTQMFSCEFCETFKKTFFYRTPLVAASRNFDRYIVRETPLED